MKIFPDILTLYLSHPKLHFTLYSAHNNTYQTTSFANILIMVFLVFYQKTSIRINNLP